jgi:hypothetical protein
LDEVAQVTLGKTPAKRDYTDEGVKILKFRDVREVGIDWTNCDQGFVPPELVDAHRLRVLENETTLITASAHSADQIGRKISFVDALPTEFETVVFTGELCAVRTRDASVMDPRWPYSFFRSRLGYLVIQDAVRGGHLTTGRAKAMPIILPSAGEQRAAIALLEEVRDLQQLAEEQFLALLSSERALATEILTGRRAVAPADMRAAHTN